MEIRIDRRRLVIGSAPEAEAAAERGIAMTREADVLLGEALAFIERERSYLRHGFSRVVDWAVHSGVDRRRALELVRAGRVFDAVPEAAEGVLSGRLTTQTVATIGRLIPAPPTIPLPDPPDPEDEARQRDAHRALAQKWLAHAGTVPPRTLRDQVAAEIEMKAQQDLVVPMRFLVTLPTRNRWWRAKKLACRTAGRVLTEGEAFAAVTTDYLERHDDLMKQSGKRRVGPTLERPGDRYVPAAVRRKVLRDAGDHCEFPGCGLGLFPELAHTRPHARRGDRETPNLGPLCGIHHRMQECGLIRLVKRTAAGATYVHTPTGNVFAPDQSKRAADPLPDECHAGGKAPAQPSPPESPDEGPPPETAPDPGCNAGSRSRRRRRAKPPDGIREPRPPPWVLQHH